MTSRPSREQHAGGWRLLPASSQAVNDARGDHHADFDGRNASASAAMRLYRGVPIELNDCVEIALSPSISVHGNVVWVNGDNYGVAFAKDDYVAGAVRRVAATRGRAREAGASAQGILPFGNGARAGGKREDAGAEPEGAEARRGGMFVPGLRVKVLLTGGRERCAVVRWSRDNIAELFLS